jgi:hypothetical protein
VFELSPVSPVGGTWVFTLLYSFGLPDILYQFES